MSKFDGMFILKLISVLLSNNTINANDIRIITRNGVYYEIEVCGIRFRDSLNLIKGSLNKLAKTYINKSKSEVDLEFSYDKLVDKANFKNIKEYCLNDSVLLLEIMVSFRNIISDRFNVDVTKTLTTSALSFKIIKKHYLNSNTIQNTSRDINQHNFISASYRGGLSTVIEPYFDQFDLTAIDINSSYPHAMTQD